MAKWRITYTPGELWRKRIIPLSRTAVYEAINTGKLESFRVNGRILVPVRAVKQFKERLKEKNHVGKGKTM